MKTALLLVACLIPRLVRADVEPSGAALYLDFEKVEPNARLFHGVKQTQGRFGGALEFTTAWQYAEVDFSRALDGIQAMTAGGGELRSRRPSLSRAGLCRTRAVSLVRPRP